MRNPLFTIVYALTDAWTSEDFCNLAGVLAILRSFQSIAYPATLQATTTVATMNFGKGRTTGQSVLLGGCIGDPSILCVRHSCTYCSGKDQFQERKVRPEIANYKRCGVLHDVNRAKCFH